MITYPTCLPCIHLGSGSTRPSFCLVADVNMGMGYNLTWLSNWQCLSQAAVQHQRQVGVCFKYMDGWPRAPGAVWELQAHGVCQSVASADLSGVSCWAIEHMGQSSSRGLHRAYMSSCAAGVGVIRRCVPSPLRVPALLCYHVFAMHCADGSGYRSWWHPSILIDPNPAVVSIRTPRCGHALPP